MQALMMQSQLMISSILTHAEKNFPDVEMVSVTVDNPRHRQNYKTFAKRCRQLAKVLASLGAEFGDRIGTLAWNDYRHMELYYGISGSGMVCHTINPKLFPEQVAYIINHAEDKILFADVLVMPLLEALKAHLGKVEAIVVMTDSAHMPESTRPMSCAMKNCSPGNQMILTGLNSTRTQPAGCVTPQEQPATRKALSTAIVQHSFML